MERALNYAFFVTAMINNKTEVENVPTYDYQCSKCKRHFEVKVIDREEVFRLILQNQQNKSPPLEAERDCYRNNNVFSF
jgi:hypothetical protein